MYSLIFTDLENKGVDKLFTYELCTVDNNNKVEAKAYKIKKLNYKLHFKINSELSVVPILRAPLKALKANFNSYK